MGGNQCELALAAGSAVGDDCTKNQFAERHDEMRRIRDHRRKLRDETHISLPGPFFQIFLVIWENSLFEQGPEEKWSAQTIVRVVETF